LEVVFRRYYSYYRGQVTDIEDPENRGRVRIRVPELFGDNELPSWAEPFLPVAGTSAAGTPFGGRFSVEVDDWIFVTFERGDARAPNYYGGWWAQDDVPEEFSKPGFSGYVFRDGTKIIVSEEQGKKQVKISSAGDGGEAGHLLIFDNQTGKEGIFLIHKTGSQMQINSKGSITVVTLDGNLVYLNAEKGEVTLTSKDGTIVSLSSKGVSIIDSSGKQMLTVGENIQVTSSKEVILTASAVNINGGCVTLGKDADKKVAIHESWAAIFDKHTHGSSTGPTSPPLPPNTAAIGDLNPSAPMGSLVVKVKGGLT
jgi:sRNA-binding carbon storage regulator CsrA